MTELRGAEADPGIVVEDAVQSALAAAAAAGVTVRSLTDLEDFRSVGRLFEDIWRPEPGRAAPVSADLLRALSKAGNYVAGAFDGDGRLVGACVGFFGAPAGHPRVSGAPPAGLHSHIAGVAHLARGRAVGFALKLHQRAWARRHGSSLISWTFDPLVSRNAYFNVVKLAARPVEYLANFYGSMRDGINGTDDSDRLFVNWNLDSSEVRAACAGGSAGSAGPPRSGSVGGVAVALDRSPSGRPALGGADAPTQLVYVPRDIEALRASDPVAAKEWRVAVRDVLGGLLAGGGRVTAFDRAGCYVVATTVSRTPSPSSTSPDRRGAS